MKPSRAALAAVLVALGAAACVPVQPPPPPPDPARPASCGSAATAGIAAPPAPTLGTPAGVPTLTTSVVKDGLAIPWDIAFEPGGGMLFTERNGRISKLTGANTSEVICQMPDVFASGEGGLTGLAVDPDFATNRFIYVCMSSQWQGVRDVRVIRWTVDGTFQGLTARADLAIGFPAGSGRHNGCRLRFDPTSPSGDPRLFVGTGDAAIGTTPQDLQSSGGKVLVMHRDGSPYGGMFGGRVFNLGHRNVQGLAFRADGFGVSVEHGSSVDDEINALIAGANFGWDPVPGYNESPVSSPMTKPGFTFPLYATGGSTFALSGATFLEGAWWGAWNGSLAVAALKNSQLYVFPVSGTSVSPPTPYLNTFGRLRAAVQGPDGALYITTSNGNDQIIQVVPS